MTHSISYSPEALGELKAIFDYIAAQSSARVAEANVDLLQLLKQLPEPRHT